MILAGIFILSACQSKMLTYGDRTVDLDRRIALEDGGPHKANWQTKDLTLDYEYTRKGNALDISGDIHLNRAKKKTLVKFSFAINLLDPSGKVLQTQSLTVTGGRRKVKTISFEKDMEIPADTRYIAFSYGGSVSGTGEGGSTKIFGELPKLMF